MEFHLRTSESGLWLLVLVAGVLVMNVNAANVNNDGNVTYGPLPAGEGYSTPATFDEGSFPLPTTWDFIGNFLQTVSPGSPPYDIINELLGNTLDIGVGLITDNVLQYQRNLMGFAICFVIGLLFCLIFPIVALCFCCCRCCCRKCGGKMHQEQEDNSTCRVLVYSLFLVASLIFVFAGAVTALCISSYTGRQAESLPTTVDNNLQDLIVFVNNTLNEIDYLMTDQLGWTLDQVRDDLDDIGTLVGVPVREALRTNVQPAIDSVIALENNINFTLETLVVIDNRQAGMESNWEYLQTNLTDVLADIATACTSCGCCNNANASLRAVSVVADYRDLNYTGMGTTGSFPQIVVNASIVELSDIVSRDLSSQAREGAQTFEDIPETLTNTTRSDVNDIKNTIDTLETSLNDLINATTSQLDVLTDQVDPFRDTASNFLTTYSEDYDKYRAYVMYFFYGFILFIVALFGMGVLLGICACERSALPTERGSCSNCGGLFLMAGSGFVLIFGMPFMLITALTFVVGGPIDRLFCDPIVSGELFAQTIDLEDAIVPGYYLGKQLFKDSSVPLTINGILTECENDRGIYSAFHLENLFNASEFTDISSQIPSVDEQFANLTGDFSNVDILTSDTRQTLIDFRDSPADTINWTLFLNELDKDLIVDNVGNADSLTTLIDALQIDADAVGGSDETTLEGYIAILQALEDDYVTSLLADAVQIADEIDLLTNYTDTIDTHVNNTIADAEVAQEFIDDSVDDSVSDSVSSYSDRVLGYPEQFVTHATDSLENSVGGCQPVYNLWNQAINTICVGILRSFNGLWFTLGWCLFFFMPALIFGVKLAKYFRTMDTTGGYADQGEGFEMQGQQHYG
ncbi:prominin-1-A-like [Diadema setosum]|uniref:prominin-1-A-like n=1 Tax=Diadema setosum TaxID=31175 RepID=UPI003B3A1218